MSGRFIDSNVILYLLDDSPKADIAEAVIRKGGMISVQVLNECLSNLRRKSRLSFHECNRFLSAIRNLLEVVPITIETHDLGRAIAEKYQLSVFDSMIIASALASGCETVLSEDMQHSLSIEGFTTIENPFRKL
jgi:predicted nucleic acid-binding protein